MSSDGKRFGPSSRESPMLPRTGQNYRYSRLENEPSDSAVGNGFVSDAFARQQLIMKSQDDELEKVGDTVGVLKDMSHRIGGELDEHSVMLEDISKEMDRTDSKMDNVMKKVAKITHLSNDRRQWYVIVALVVALIVVILLFIIL